MAKSEAGAVSADIRKMSFEEALSELEEIVQELESGEADLERSIDRYTRGTQLKTHCEEKLKAAQTKIDKIVEQADGTLSTEPAGIE